MIDSFNITSHKRIIDSFNITSLKQVEANISREGHRDAKFAFAATWYKFMPKGKHQ